MFNLRLIIFSRRSAEDVIVDVTVHIQTSKPQSALYSTMRNISKK